MSSHFNFVLGFLLLIATMIVFASIGRFASPRLLNDVTQLTVEFGCVGASCESADDVVAQLTPTSSPTKTPLPPTNTSIATTVPPTATAIPPTVTAPATVTPLVITPTERPTETVAPTEQPTETLVPTETPIPSQTPTPDALLIEAVRDAGLFAEPGGLGGHTGYYVPTGQTGWVIGRSPDTRWLHVAHLLGIQGWAAASFFSAAEGELATLPVSDFVGEGDPNVTIRATQVAQLPPATTTPPPSSTPSPNETLQSDVTISPTNTPWPTNTPRPTNDTSPVNTPWPTATWVKPTVFPTNTPLPTPLPSNGNDGEQEDDIVTNAIAWWQTDQSSILINGDGTWRADVIIRVPTSFTYSFKIPLFSTNQRLRDQNLEGDDFFVLSIAGVPCGLPLNAELIALQNGARMIVSNEFTLQKGVISISTPC